MIRTLAPADHDTLTADDWKRISQCVQHLARTPAVQMNPTEFAGLRRIAEKLGPDGQRMVTL